MEFGGLNLVEAASQTHFIVPPHQHEATHVTLMLEGNCADTYRNHARTLTPLTALYFHPGESHGLHVGQQPIRTFDIEITPHWFRQHEALAASPMAVLESSRYATGWLMTRLYREFKERDDLSPLVMEGLLLEIFADLVRAAKSGKVKSAPFWLHRVKELIADEFARPLTLAEMAKTVGVHPAYLAHVFRQHYHCTPGEFLRRIRIERASEYLCHSNLSLAEIALATGFADQSHFSRLFKRAMGLTPSQFRNLHRRR